jgi:chemotaxis protein methyltransferase WspC
MAGARESELRMPARQRKTAPLVAATAPTSPELANTATPSAALAEAFRCADRGQLNEAKLHCENYLQLHGPCAEAFYVLALVNDALGKRREAVACYRKVLYLVPDHIEALAHLACLQDQLGNRVGARLLHQRRHRAQARQKTR